MNKIRRIPTCKLCGKRFKTTQGLGGHRVLYHRSDNNGEHSETSVVNLDKASMDNLTNRLTSIEGEVKGLQLKTSQKEELPIGLWTLAVCLKCGMVLQYDKTFRKGGLFFEDDHFECPKCGPVKEVIEVISRQKVNAKEWGKETPEEKEAKVSLAGRL
jgi:hypothetical protein